MILVNFPHPINSAKLIFLFGNLPGYAVTRPLTLRHPLQLPYKSLVGLL